MTAAEMHYDLKMKLNKIDSQKYTNLVVPEIDWLLNEAQEIFVKSIAEPRLGKEYGFETNQRTINDIRTIVVNQNITNSLFATSFDDKSYTVTLPDDYWFKASATVLAVKGDCQANIRTSDIQHDDEAEESVFDKSNFEWRHINIRYFGNYIRIFTDGTFTISRMFLDYLKQPRRIHNAQAFRGGSYKLLDGVTILTGTQSCELPTNTHHEIVDIAVLIATDSLKIPGYQEKLNKVKQINEI